MTDKWFISDTHFFHEKCFSTFKNADGSPMRPFKSVEEMNETMIQNWNRVVKPNDKVYHLGDVAVGFGGDDHKLGNLLSRLMGKKRLVVGNHDNLKSVALQTHFDKLEMWYGRKEWGFTCTHVPYILHHLRDGDFNVHGHVHNNTVNNPSYFNACVEVNDYKPVHIDTILKKFKVASH